MFSSTVNCQVNQEELLNKCLCLIIRLLTNSSFSMTGVPVYGGLSNPKVTFSDNVKLTAGANKISLLSVAVGLPVSQFALLNSLCSLPH